MGSMTGLKGDGADKLLITKKKIMTILDKTQY